MSTPPPLQELKHHFQHDSERDGVDNAKKKESRKESGSVSVSMDGGAVEPIKSFNEMNGMNDSLRRKLLIYGYGISSALLLCIVLLNGEVYNLLSAISSIACSD
tara:strand:+ start:401 stop:712 length:312 start_codon:yes stop_codon:yes gene_type:complete